MWNSFPFAVDVDQNCVWRWTKNKKNGVCVAGLLGISSMQYEALRGPAGFYVMDDGAVLVADSKNHRIVKWGAEPAPKWFTCEIGESCSLDLEQGNFLQTNGIIVPGLKWLGRIFDCESSCIFHVCFRKVECVIMCIETYLAFQNIDATFVCVYVYVLTNSFVR